MAQFEKFIFENKNNIGSKPKLLKTQQLIGNSKCDHCSEWTSEISPVKQSDEPKH